MLVNSSDNSGVGPTSTSGIQTHRLRWSKTILLGLWVVIGFAAARALVVGTLVGLHWVGVPVKSINQAVLTTVASAVIYVVTLLLVVGLPWGLKKYRTTKQDIGVTRLPSWMDIGLAPAGFIIYFLSSALLAYFVSMLIPTIDINQVQNIGFDASKLTHYYEYVLTFVTLIIVAPVVEEIVFRGYLYGKLRKIIPVWVAILVTSVLFGAVHGQWNVAIDVFALSVVLCSLREVTGNIWAGILLHMLKNSLAFYVLFINPALLHTIGG